MGATSNTVQIAIKRLEEDPTDARSLKIVLNYVKDIKQDYFRPGEFYGVHTKDRGFVVKELKAFLGPCSTGCPSNGCPGILVFEDGTEACPFPNWGPPVRRAMPTSTTAAVRKIEELLSKGKSKAKVELVDGRWVHISIKKPQA